MKARFKARETVQLRKFLADEITARQSAHQGRCAPRERMFPDLLHRILFQVRWRDAMLQFLSFFTDALFGGQRLQAGYRGAVTVRWTQTNSDTRVIAENLLLQTFAFQKRNNECSDALTLEVRADSERPLQHQIIEPIRLVLRKSGDRYHALDILVFLTFCEIRRVVDQHHARVRSLGPEYFRGGTRVCVL